MKVTSSILILAFCFSCKQDPWITRLKSADKVVVAEAINELANQHNYHYTETIVNVLFSKIGNYAIVQNAIGVYLNRTAAASYVPLIESHINQGDDQFNAVQVCAKLHSPESINILIQIINQAKDLRIKDRAYGAIIKINSHKRISDVKWVKSENGIVIRESADKNSKSLGVIPYQKAISIISESRKEKINGVDGQWVMTRHDGILGYVFDGFLSDESILQSDYFRKGYVSRSLAFECCISKTHNLEVCQGGGLSSAVEYGYNAPSLDEDKKREPIQEINLTKEFPCETFKDQLYQKINEQYKKNEVYVF